MKQIQEEKVRNEGNLNAVIKAHEKLQSDDKVSPYHKVVDPDSHHILLITEMLLNYDF